MNASALQSIESLSMHEILKISYSEFRASLFGGDTSSSLRSTFLTIVKKPALVSSLQRMIVSASLRGNRITFFDADEAELMSRTVAFMTNIDDSPTVCWFFVDRHVLTCFPYRTIESKIHWPSKCIAVCCRNFASEIHCNLTFFNTREIQCSARFAMRVTVDLCSQLLLPRGCATY